MTIRNILVPIDGSKNSFRGLDNAIYIARQCHAVITGLYVISLLSEPKKGATLSSIGKMLLKDARQSMEKAKLHSAQNGILFKSKIAYGDTGPKIVDFARRNGFDLIVMGSRGRGLVKDVFLGSTSNHVVHKSQIPVMICK
ncbi:MAG: universal stress protein [Nitrosopumilaceae archaeon]